MIADFRLFDEDYLRRLKDGEPLAEEHFANYFGELITLKVRNRIRTPQLVEEIRQETFLRVLKVLHDDGVIHPERFGAFVHSVTRNVMCEYGRNEKKHASAGDPENEPLDTTIDLDAPLINRDLRMAVERVLASLPEKQRAILKARFLDDATKEEISRQFGVAPDYLRVLLHRARVRFKKTWLEKTASSDVAAPSGPV